jgi:hypothetical protein
VLAEEAMALWVSVKRDSEVQIHAMQELSGRAMERLRQGRLNACVVF